MKKNKKKGFSLLELLIVVAIILIIATIAIPSLLRSRQSTNETAAVGDLRTANTAQVTYASSNSQQYGSIQEVTNAGLLDNRFVDATAGKPLHGMDWAEGVTGIHDPNDTTTELGGTSPSAYGFSTTPNGTSARYDYCSGTDAVVRYLGAVAVPPNKAAMEAVQ